MTKFIEKLLELFLQKEHESSQDQELWDDLVFNKLIIVKAGDDPRKINSRVLNQYFYRRNLIEYGMFAPRTIIPNKAFLGLAPPPRHEVFENKCKEYTAAWAKFKSAALYGKANYTIKPKS
jgi:hypothetical protein